eukprot:m.909 g.909  ORF g.909 m.909 type:complete len:189 (+) comp5134_c0_seq1:40-606(+)
MISSFVSFVTSDPSGSLQILSVLYLFPSLVLWLSLDKRDGESKLISTLRFLTLILIGSICFHVVAVLFGAPLLSSIKLTFLYSTLLSVMTVAPASVILREDSENWSRVLLASSPETCYECMLFVLWCCTLIGSWFGAAAIPLDWEKPWQNWPIPCAIGACAGHLIGLGASFFVWIFYGKQKNRHFKTT